MLTVAPPKFRRFSSVVAAASLAAAVLSTTSCKSQDDTVKPMSPDEPARRSAVAFMHCAEQNGADCIGANAKQGAWDAFALVNWLSSGSPLGILGGFSSELEHHSDPFSVQERFVVQVAGVSHSLRGAQCETVGMVPFSDVLPILGDLAHTRLDRLGLWNPDVQGVVEELVREASAGLHDGYLAKMHCRSEPWQMYIATANSIEGFKVVGMVPDLPKIMGGEDLNSEVVGLRLNSKLLSGRRSATKFDETLVGPWMAFPIQEL